jgi:nicotinate-nucleotide adenylyltransferase
LICLYGGTFDPVHNGHLHAALAVCDALDQPAISLVLSARPSHRGRQGATVAQRWDMLRLACEQDDRLQPDDRELHRSGPSYTVKTLEAARAEHPDTAINWVIGSDAYRLLASWYQWQRVIELANLIVLNRPGHPLALDETMSAFTRERQVTQLGDELAGSVWLLNRPMLEISAASIRALLVQGKSADHLLPGPVATYIRQHSLYGVISDP